jgi:hypothetical protein
MATTSRDPSEVLIPMPHLNKNLTVRLAALNAALAGCLPEYFPVVLAAWDAFLLDGMVTRSIWQSTTGTAPFVVVYGPVRQRIGLNSRGNVWGSGFRANATIGRAIRLGADNGIGTDGSAVSATVIRSVLHIEARHTTSPEQLVADFADSLCRTGALVRPWASGYVVLNPEHARLLDKHGWSKNDVRAAIVEQGWRTHRDLARTGKEAFASDTGWRLPADHPDAQPQEPPEDPDTPVQLIAHPDAVQIVVCTKPLGKRSPDQRWEDDTTHGGPVRPENPQLTRRLGWRWQVLGARDPDVRHELETVAQGRRCHRRSVRRLTVADRDGDRSGVPGPPFSVRVSDGASDRRRVVPGSGSLVLHGYLGGVAGRRPSPAGARRPVPSAARPARLHRSAGQVSAAEAPVPRQPEAGARASVRGLVRRPGPLATWLEPSARYRADC